MIPNDREPIRYHEYVWGVFRWENSEYGSAWQLKGLYDDLDRARKKAKPRDRICQYNLAVEYDVEGMVPR